MAGGPPLGIRLHGLSKAFGVRRALDHVDLDVDPGFYVAVMGANGAGKSTLLRSVAGLVTPTSGSVTVAGVEMRKAGSALRRRIGFAGHESMLYPDLTARENLMFHARLFGLSRPDRAVERVADRLRLDGTLDRQVRVLSRGTRQRVAIARALINDPAVVLLDEPFTGLDAAAVADLARLLDSLHTPERVLIMTVHDVARAIAGPDRLVVLSAGRLVLDRPVGAPAPEIVEDVTGLYMGLLRAEAAS